MCLTEMTGPIGKNENRKPGPGMLLRAATELGLDLPASWMVGDLISDVLAGLNAGCRSILVKSGPEPHDGPEDEAPSGRYLVLPDFVAAAETILEDRRGHPFPAPATPGVRPGGHRGIGVNQTSWMIHRSRPERLRRSGLPIWATSIP